jgi:hypothetical protein
MPEQRANDEVGSIPPPQEQERSILDDLKKALAKCAEWVRSNQRVERLCEEAQSHSDDC